MAGLGLAAFFPADEKHPEQVHRQHYMTGISDDREASAGDRQPSCIDKTTEKSHDFGDEGQDHSPFSRPIRTVTDRPR